MSATLASILTPRFERRFWQKVAIRGPDDCWPWTGDYWTNGRGKALVIVDGRRRTMGAPKVAYILTHRRLPPPDYKVCHHCDFPPCCNPTHLFVGTDSDNQRDRRRKELGHVWTPRP